MDDEQTVNDAINKSEMVAGSKLCIRVMMPEKPAAEASAPGELICLGALLAAC